MRVPKKEDQKISIQIISVKGKKMKNIKNQCDYTKRKKCNNVRRKNDERKACAGSLEK